MKCVVCRNGRTYPGTTTVTLADEAANSGVEVEVLEYEAAGAARGG